MPPCPRSGILLGSESELNCVQRTVLWPRDENRIADTSTSKILNDTASSVPELVHIEEARSLDLLDTERRGNHALPASLGPRVSRWV